MRPRHGCRLLLVLSVWLVACARPRPPDPAPVDLLALQQRTLAAIRSHVVDHSLYADVQGEAWPAASAPLQERMAAGLGAAEFTPAVAAMLDRLPGGLRLAPRAARIAAIAAVGAGSGAYVAPRAAPEPRLVVLDVAPDSPAAAAGLVAHDAVLAIAGRPVAPAARALDVDLRWLLSPASPARPLTLTVRSPDAAVRQLAIRPAAVESTAAATVTTAGLPGRIGYLRLPPAPGDNLVGDVVQALETVAAQGQMAGLILDLRPALASDRWPLTEMLTLFADGPVGALRTRTGREPITVTGLDLLHSQTVPLAVLVGVDTQGRPALFAAALQATGRAVLVGQPTTGAVAARQAFLLPNGDHLLVPTATYDTPAGRDVGLLGVAPDRVVEAAWDDIRPDHDPVLDAAVALLPGSGP